MIQFTTPHAPRRRNVPKGPQRRAAAAFFVAAAGGVGFAWAYVADAPVWWLGLPLAVAFAALAYGFASWVALLPQGPYVEKRESMVPPRHEQDVLAQDLGAADGAIVSAPMPRRALTIALSVLGIAAIFPLRSLYPQRRTQPQTALKYTPWRPGIGVVTHDGTRVRPGDLDVGTALTVYPEGHVEASDAGVLLLRVPPAELQLPAERMAWTVDGVIGYSKICTHAGCPVGLFAQGGGELMCPCHQSVFDVYRLAEPLYGPAARPLPQLPLGLADDGTLIALGDFPTPIGPGYWRQS